MDISDLEDLVKKKHRAIRKGNLRGAIETGNELGFCYNNLGRHEEALEEYKQSLEFCISNNDLMEQATAHRYIGETFSRLNSYKEALKHHRVYLELALKCKNQVEEQRAYTTVGNTHLDFAASRMRDSEGRMALRKAEESFNFALNLSEKVKSKVSKEEYAQMKARLFMNLALVCELCQKEELCVNYFHQSVKISEEYNLTEDLYRSLYNLSQYYKRCGKSKEAMNKCILACNCAVKMKDDNIEMEALTLMAKIHLSASEFKLAKEKLSVIYKKRHCSKTVEYGEAERMLKKVFKLLHLIEDIDSISKKDAKTLYPMYEKAGDKAVALESFEFALCAYKNMEKCAKALGMKGRELCPIYISIWKTLKDLHRYQESLTYLEKEEKLELTNHKQLFKIFLEKAEMLDLLRSNYEQVRDVLASAYHQAELLKSTDKQIYALRKLLSWQQREDKMDESPSTRNLLESLVGKEDMDKLPGLSSPPHSDNEDDDEDDYDSDDDLELDKEIDLCSDNETEEKVVQQNPKKNILGETQLHRASIEGNFRKVKALLDKGHPVNVRDNCGWLPIHEAASNGFLEIAEVLLDRGATMNDRGGDKCQGFTPLHDACSNAHVDIIELLVNRGADLLLKNDLGDLPVNTLEKYCLEMDDDETSTEVYNCLKMLTEATERQRMSLLRPFGVNKSNVTTLKKPITKDSTPTSTATPTFKRASSPSNENNSMEDIHDVSSPESSLRRSKSKTIAIRKSAKKEYKDAMSKVKRPHTDVDDIPEKPRPKMALMEESECVGLNDWLVNDVSNDSDELQVNQKFKQKDLKSSRKVTKSKHSFSCEDDDDMRNIRNDKRGVIDIVPKDDAYNKRTVVQFDDENMSFHERNDAKMSSPIMTKWINVIIGEKSLGVPYSKSDQQHTVSWLADQAASRYYTIFGRKPRLTIMVRGMIMMPGDLLEGLLTDGDEIVASVNEWVNLPIETIYKDACAKFSSSFCSNSQNILMESEESGFLDFSDKLLQLPQWRPICHVMQSLTSLTQLHLKGNKLRNEGFEILLDVFKCLPYLKVLDVSCNHMTHDSVGALSNYLQNYPTVENKPLQSLEVLLLANNSFLDISATHLFTCLRHLPTLKHLNINSCSLTEKLLDDIESAIKSLKGGLLNYLDLGGSNDFERLDPTILFKCLDFSRLQTLKLPRLQSNFVQLLRSHLEELNGNISFKFLSIDGKPTF